MKFHDKRIKRLRDIDFDSEVLDRARQIARQIESSDADITIREDGQGSGKSTAFCILAEKGDRFFMEGHKQLKEKRQLLENIGVPCTQFYGLETLIDPQADEDKFDEKVKELRKNAPLKDMANRWSDKGKDVVKVEYEEEPLIEYHSQQLEIEELEQNVILATTNMIPVLRKQKLKRFKAGELEVPELGDIMLDEGIERKRQTKKIHIRQFNLRKEFFDKLEYIDEHEESGYTMEQAYRKFQEFHTLLFSSVTEFIEDSNSGWEHLHIPDSELPRSEKPIGFWNQMSKMHEKHGLMKSEFQIELKHQIREENWDVVDKLQKLKELMDFWKSMDATNQCLYHTNGDDPAKLVIDNLYIKYIMHDRTAIAHAESSAWMEEALPPFIDLERKSIKNKTIEAEKILVHPRSNKKTFPKKNTKKYRHLYEQVNLLAEENSVGAITYKKDEDLFSEEVVTGYWGGDIQGSNRFKEVDYLFVFGGFRMPSHVWIRQFYNLYGRFPHDSYEKHIVGDEDGQTGLAGDLELFWDIDLDRRIRDAVGRGRTAQIIVKIGYGGDKIDWDREGEIDVFHSVVMKEFGRQKYLNHPETPDDGRSIKGLNQSGNWKVDELTDCDRKTTEEIVKELEKQGIQVSESKVDRTLMNKGWDTDKAGIWKKEFADL